MPKVPPSPPPFKSSVETKTIICTPPRDWGKKSPKRDFDPRKMYHQKKKHQS